MSYDVFGLGNPLIDVIIQAQDQDLQKLGLHKGSMNLMDEAGQERILQGLKGLPRHLTLGGSCANSMVMIAQLGGKSAYCGRLGQDEFGKDYESQLVEAGVTSLLKKSTGTTGSTVILVTPDADRTMNTHLGQCQALAASDLDPDQLAQAKYLYVEGYLWDTDSQKQAVMRALEVAKDKGVKIALTLSDSFCVSRHQADFARLMDQYVDLLFCNEHEAKMMTTSTDPQEQIQELAQKVNQVVLTLGKEGALLYDQKNLDSVEAVKVQAVDTTGAGDSFAAGFLYGITQGYSQKDAGKLASLCAATIVSQKGPRFQGDFRAQVKACLKD